MTIRSPAMSLCRRAIASAAMLASAAPAFSQVREASPNDFAQDANTASANATDRRRESDLPTQANVGVKKAASSAGVVGERQDHDHDIAGIEPLARIDVRVQNRIQSRIRNRIDRYYDPQANAMSPFKVAGDQARIAGQRNGR